MTRKNPWHRLLPRLATPGILALTLVCLPLLATGPARAGEDSDASAADTATTPAQAAFERLKALEGTWTGPGSEGGTVTMEYEVVGDGSALVEHFRMSEMPDHTMVTVYHLDGDELVLTHYCSAGNQPTMRARGEDIGEEELRFEVSSVTNLASPDAGHMREAVIRLDGVHGHPSDRYDTAWTWTSAGEDTEIHRIQARRSGAGTASGEPQEASLDDGRGRE